MRVNYNKVFKECLEPHIIHLGFERFGPGFFHYDRKRKMLMGFGILAFNGLEIDLLAEMSTMSIDVKESLHGKTIMPNGFVYLSDYIQKKDALCSRYVVDESVGDYRYTSESFARHVELVYAWFTKALWESYFERIQDNKMCYAFIRNNEYRYACQHFCVPQLGNNFDMLHNDLKSYYSMYHTQDRSEYGMAYWPLRQENMMWEALEVREYEDAKKTAAYILANEAAAELQEKDLALVYNELRKDGYFQLHRKAQLQYAAKHKDIFDEKMRIIKRYRGFVATPEDIARCNNDKVKRMNYILSLLESKNHDTIQNMVDERIVKSITYCERVFK